MNPKDRQRSMTYEEWELLDPTNGKDPFRFKLNNYLTPLLLSLCTFLIWDQIQDLKKSLSELHETTSQQGKELSNLRATVDYIKGK